MSNAFQAQQLYKTAEKETASPKAIELKVFMQVTTRIKTLDKNATDFRARRAEVLLENAKLWQIIFIDLVKAENTLPLALKENLLSIAGFVQNHTRAVFSDKVGHEVLIDINESMIAGLKQSLRTSAANAQPQLEVA